MTMTYRIGKGLEYEHFDQIAHDIQDGDSVIFTSGTHLVLASDLSVSNLTINGENAANTIVNFKPDQPNTTVFNVLESTQLTISNITFTVAPKTTLINLQKHTQLEIDHSDISWNNFNIKELTDNLPVIKMNSNTTTITNFIAVEVTLPAVEIIAEQISINSVVIGDANGSVGTLSGWVDDSINVSVNTMKLGLVGEIKNIEILGASSIEDVHPQLISEMPNLNNAPLVLDGVVYSQKMAIQNPTKDQKKIIWLKKRYHKQFKFQTDPLNYIRFNYYLMNNKNQGSLFIISEPSDFPDDQPLIYNNGNLVMTGSETDLSNFKNVQAKGQLLLNNFNSEIPWIFEDDGLDLSKVKISNSKIGKVPSKNAKFKLINTNIAPNLDSEIPDILRLKGKYLGLNESPVLEELMKHTDVFEDSFPTIFLKGKININEIHDQLKIFTDQLYTEKLITTDFTMHITEETILKRSPNTRKEVLIKRQHDVWYFPSWELFNTQNGKLWLKLIHTMMTQLTFYPKFVFYDTDPTIITTAFEETKIEFPNAILIDIESGEFNHRNIA